MLKINYFSKYVSSANQLSLLSAFEDTSQVCFAMQAHHLCAFRSLFTNLPSDGYLCPWNLQAKHILGLSAVCWGLAQFLIRNLSKMITSGSKISSSSVSTLAASLSLLIWICAIFSWYLFPSCVYMWQKDMWCNRWIWLGVPCSAIKRTDWHWRSHHPVGLFLCLRIVVVYFYHYSYIKAGPYITFPPFGSMTFFPAPSWVARTFECILLEMLHTESPILRVLSPAVCMYCWLKVW